MEMLPSLMNACAKRRTARNDGERHDLFCVWCEYNHGGSDILTCAQALPAERIMGVETGGCPHTAIRQDASMKFLRRVARSCANRPRHRRLGRRGPRAAAADVSASADRPMPTALKNCCGPINRAQIAGLAARSHGDRLRGASSFVGDLQDEGSSRFPWQQWSVR